MARAAWEGIVAIFKSAINGLIDMLNKIPGVEIDAAFGDLPSPSEIGGLSAPIADEARKRMNGAMTSISPNGPTAVPPGGLLRSIQNSNTQTQSKTNHIEKVEIHTAKPMSPLELESMMSMAVGG
jgi:hypothetical protein